LRGMAKRYRTNPLVVGHDLRNEVRPNLLRLVRGLTTMPTWGDTSAIHPWKQSFLIDYGQAVEKAGAAVLQADPDALVIVEALAGLMLCSFQLKDEMLQSMQGHVVWSAHDYHWWNREVSFMWDVCARGIQDYYILSFARYIYEEIIPALPKLTAAIAGLSIAMYFKRFHGSCSLLTLVVLIALFLLNVTLQCSLTSLPIDSYEAYVQSRDAIFGHIATSGIGPVWIGEFGTDIPNLHWNWTIAYLKERDFDFAYWSIDGEHFPNLAQEFGEHVPGLSHEESFGLWETNYQTVRHKWKLQDLQALMEPAMTAASAKVCTARQAHPSTMDL